MDAIPTILLITGITFILLAMLWHLGEKYFPLGRLPGDITVEKGNFRLYYPLATSIVLSVLLTRTVQ